MNLQGEARLGCAMPPLWATRRLVGKNPDSFKLIGGKFVANRLERARVIDGRQPVAAVAAAIQERSKVHGLERAVVLDPGPDPHLDRMSTPVHVKGFFPGESELHRPSGYHRELGRAHLVREGIALAAKAAANRRRNHPDTAHGQLENLGESPVQIMGRLGGRPDSEFILRTILGQSAVLLHRQVRVALKEKGIFKNLIGLCKTLNYVAELKKEGLLDIRPANHRIDAFKLGGSVSLDPADTRMRQRATEELPIEHAGKFEIVGITGIARGFRP